uniref:Uncharacterized protein n=1 Tax=Anguilla anguilla TaxID=7936 RepID=A0A0E9V256_ANGAN
MVNPFKQMQDSITPLINMIMQLMIHTFKLNN